MFLFFKRVRLSKKRLENNRMKSLMNMFFKRVRLSKKRLGQNRRFCFFCEIEDNFSLEKIVRHSLKNIFISLKTNLNILPKKSSSKNILISPLKLLTIKN